MHLIFMIVAILFGYLPQDPIEKEIVGVYKGVSLFIQNPFLQESREFCINAIYLNNKKLDLNYRLSALKIDFEGSDLFTPVSIRIVSSDSLCEPIIINPDAILFHTAYRFRNVFLTDSALTWETQGERETGIYTVERLDRGFWEEVDRRESFGKFENAKYAYLPILEEGSNKYRVKYDFGNGKYLYSDEVEFDYYPESVTFSPKETRKKIFFSRSANYEVYDPNSKLVLSGTGIELDVSALYPGEYVIYFNGKDPGVFTKQR